MAELSGDVTSKVTLGFQLKHNAKRNKITSTANILDCANSLGQENEESKEAVTEITRGVIKSATSSTSGSASLLIIPLPPTRLATLAAQSTRRSATAASNDTDDVTKTLEQVAADELVAESTGEKKCGINASSLSIAVAGNSLVPAISQSKGPLLMANIAPELLAARDDEERFKMDISMRPQDMNVRSDAYKAVPIEEFGAAMLRGMGWTGPSLDEAEKDSKHISMKDVVVPRENRLGLGATPRPPEEKARGNKEKNEQKTKEWEKKAQDLLKKQNLAEDDVVWLRDAQYAGRRAVVTAIRGVPGLDRIRVRLETSGAAIEIRRVDAVLLSQEEAEAEPFRGVPADSTAASETTSTKFFGLMNDHAADVYSNNNSSTSSHATSRKRDRESGSSSGVSKNVCNLKQRRVEQECDDLPNGFKADSDTDSKKMLSNSKSEVSTPGWLTAGIRVRIVSKKLESATPSSSCYLSKGSIVAVLITGRATVRLDDGRTIESVREKYLETVLPTVDGVCAIVLGKHRGQTAILLEKRKDAGQALVQLSGAAEAIVVSMDHIAAMN